MDMNIHNIVEITLGEIEQRELNGEPYTMRRLVISSRMKVEGEVRTMQIDLYGSTVQQLIMT